MRNYTQEDLEAHCRKLWDTQWMNVVNHDNCYRGWAVDEAVNHAVKMAEEYMRENFDAYVATLRQQATNAPEIGSKLVGDGAVSDEAVGKLRSWIVSKTGMRIHPGELRAAIEAVAPLLRPPAEQGGRVDGFEDWWERTESDVSSPHDAAKSAWQAAIAQNVQVPRCDCGADYAGPIVIHKKSCSLIAQNAQGDGWAVVLMSVTDEVTPVLQPLEGWRDLPNGNYRLYTHAERARVPDGWALVPTQPTPFMIGEGAWAYRQVDGNLADAWKAMLAAAPSQPEDATKPAKEGQ